jgi:phosphoglycolate phosphatase-like HAD superfamily hydrolase
MSITKLYALDFDGVICDSAIETGMTGWKVASQLWPDMPTEIPSDMLEKFRQVRPVMETGYEAILIMRKLFEGIDPRLLLDHFTIQIKTISRRDELNIPGLKRRFGEQRDTWIHDNIDEWIMMNPLFDGIAEKLHKMDNQLTYIITTKQERFVSQILKANNIIFPAKHIYGLERELSKQQILADLSATHLDHNIVFVEDRLPTLINVRDDDRLAKVQLYFSDWGYNTDQDKLAAKEQPTITTINLAEMLVL